VEQEAPDELVGAERHCAVPRLLVAAVILVTEGHTALVESKQAAVCDGDAVGIAGEIGEHCLRPSEGWLGVDEPVLAPQRCKMGLEGSAAPQALEIAEEHQPTRRMGLSDPGQEEPPEQAGEHPHR
jgi:hypothetical protein